MLAVSPIDLPEPDLQCALCLNDDNDNLFGIEQLASYALIAMVSLCGVVRSTVQYMMEVSLSIVPSIPQIWISMTDFYQAFNCKGPCVCS